ncbi:MAG: ABC transporter permease subunit [Candidatus Methanofastidiosia archaeon]|jgi:peptide/nickel transport system permease protein
MQCSICGKNVVDGDDIHCAFCHNPFHTVCILHYIHQSGLCPVCKKNLSLTDLYYGDQRYQEQKQEKLQKKPHILPEIRKPQWPELNEIPLFDIDTEFIPLEPIKKISWWQKVLSQYFFQRTFTQFKKNKKGMAGIYMLTLAGFIAVLAPLLILYDPAFYMSEDAFVYHPPTWQYPLGTDILGRDVYSQLVWGFRTALAISIPSAVLVGIVGTVVGLLSGYYGGVVDTVLQRISITFLVWPSVPLVALIVFSWGPSLTLLGIITGVSVTLWPTTARAIRAEVMSIRNRAFIEFAIAAGASSNRIVFRHILPSVIHITFVYMTIAVASALVLEATFNFLGLTSPAVVTWGQMLSFTYHASTARFGTGGAMGWWTVIPPTAAIAYMVLSFLFISTGLRESMRIKPVQF